MVTNSHIANLICQGCHVKNDKEKKLFDTEIHVHVEKHLKGIQINSSCSQAGQVQLYRVNSVCLICYKTGWLVHVLYIGNILHDALYMYLNHSIMRVNLLYNLVKRQLDGNCW